MESGFECYITEDNKPVHQERVFVVLSINTLEKHTLIRKDDGITYFYSPTEINHFYLYEILSHKSHIFLTDVLQGQHIDLSSLYIDI